MKITPDYTQQAARSLLRLLEERNVREPNDLRDIYGKYRSPEDAAAFIEVTSNLSNGGLFVPTMSYVIPGAGILLETKVNDLLDYMKIIVKVDRPLSGYRAFMLDLAGNIAQDRTIQEVAIPLLKLELEELTEEHVYNT